MNQNDLLVDAKDLEKSFLLDKRVIHVLRKISMQIHRGEFVAIVGPSGAGKSTLLHILGLLETPTAGSIQLMGDDSTRMSESKRSQIRCSEIGFVFQFHHLLPGFTALENVTMPGRILGTPLDEIHARAEDLLKTLGLGHRLKNKPTELSGGEQQRVAVARALINSPSLILADEPSGNLDRETGRSLENDLIEFARDGAASVVVVTHNQKWASRADRTLKLLDGQIEETTSELQSIT